MPMLGMNCLNMGLDAADRKIRFMHSERTYIEKELPLYVRGSGGRRKRTKGS
jgi:hypothetical protein